MTPLTRHQIAWRAAQDLPEGAYVNLGIGIPTLAASYVPAAREVIFHSENGVLGLGPALGEGLEGVEIAVDGSAGWSIALTAAPSSSRCEMSSAARNPAPHRRPNRSLRP